MIKSFSQFEKYNLYSSNKKSNVEFKIFSFIFGFIKENI